MAQPNKNILNKKQYIKYVPTPNNKHLNNKHSQKPIIKHLKETHPKHQKNKYIKILFACSLPLHVLVLLPLRLHGILRAVGLFIDW